MRADPVRSFAADVFPNFNAARRVRRQGLPPAAAPKCPPAMSEVLEPRRMLASVSFSSGVWTLSADNTTETIYVYRVIETSPASDRIKFQIGSTIWSRDSADITSKVRVLARAGDDTVHVETDQEVANNLTVLSLNAKGNDGVDKVVEVLGGDGLDTVYGGDMADTLQGDADHDGLYGRGGNDVVYGGYGGDDDAEGGEGNDLMYGGDPNYGGGDDEAGDDTLDGQGGADSLYGQAGDDSLLGGLGNDFMYGGSGADRFVAGYSDGADSLDGGSGTDIVEAHDSGGTDSLTSIESILG